jgi:hypothetical protein
MISIALGPDFATQQRRGLPRGIIALGPTAQGAKIIQLPF